MITIGVIADTHIPDRARALTPAVLDVFTEANVAAILHAGDISSPNVLQELETISPVYAVKGNRDWLLLRRLPFISILEFNGVKIGLTHGHGRLGKYLLDRLYYSIRGYNHEHIIPWLLHTFPDTDVIVFGHGHIPLNSTIERKLLFNPGSPHVPKTGLSPTIGLLHIQHDVQVSGEIIELSKYTFSGISS